MVPRLSFRGVRVIPPAGWAALAAAGVVSWIGTGAARRYALAHALLDVPNARSSHERPTPRGGGLAIAAVTLGGTALAGWLGALSPATTAAIVGGGAAVAAIGWLDDRRGVSAASRAAVHALATVWLVAWLGQSGVREGAALGPVAAVLWTLAIMWSVNLYNFLDGIDGLAGSEAVGVGLVGGALLLASGATGLAAIAFLVAAASAGFLWWNWAPARIFMGDVGSGLLGFFFAALTFASHRAGVIAPGVWMLLLGVFLFDATVTVLRRILRRERWHAAHRSHAYQRAVQAGWSHAQVTGCVVATNLVLALLAWAGWRRPERLPAFVAAGVLLVAALYAAVERRRPMAAPERRASSTFTQ